MTKQQYKIFTAVRKYKKLGKVLEVTKVGDYIKLQETVGADMLDFSDVKYNDDTDVTLWCCTIKVDIENSKGQYIEKDKQEATKDGSESTKIQHGI